jgi:hypothetical protein
MSRWISDDLPIMKVLLAIQSVSRGHLSSSEPLFQISASRSLRNSRESFSEANNGNSCVNQKPLNVEKNDFFLTRIRK